MQGNCAGCNRLQKARGGSANAGRKAKAAASRATASYAGPHVADDTARPTNNQGADHCRSIVDKAVADFGRIDILVIG